MARTPHAPSFRHERKIPIKCVTTLDLFEEKIPYKRVWYWATKGCRGVFLETRREGGLRYTSREAVARFIERTQ